MTTRAGEVRSEIPRVPSGVGNPAVVHRVTLFRLAVDRVGAAPGPGPVEAAQQVDAREDGPGCTPARRVWASSRPCAPGA